MGQHAFVSLDNRFEAIHLAVRARIASLHLHPAERGRPLTEVESLEVVEQMGLVGDRRYFGRKGQDGAPGKRQVTLIEREQLAEHASALGLRELPPGAVRSNIETEGIELVPLIGHRIVIGTAILEIAAPRDPCSKMDEVAPGLRERMLQDRQGVLARVVRSGVIQRGDPIHVLPAEE